MKILNFDSFELEYEIREEDNEFLKNFNKDKYNKNFKEAIETIKKANISEDLINLIEITLTELPEEIDVVKYFEVMNNRGKQLEKHQILKAKFLEVLKDDKDLDYAKIWDYCSEISSTIEDLIYYNDFKKEQKKEGAVFDLRKNLLEFKFEKYFEENKNDNNNISISEALKNKEFNETEKNYQGRKEYRSIIKFPIFLIQVLKLFIIKNKGKNEFKDLNEIIVNDIYLLDYFYEDEKHTKFLFNNNLAKDFILFMLKIRILFDCFVFKRDENDNPVLLKEIIKIY